MTMQGKAIDVVVGELDKLAMCKRGALDTEENSRKLNISKVLNKLKEPKLTVPQRAKIFTKNRKALLRILKFKSSQDLFYLSSTSCEGRCVTTTGFYTPESMDKYNEECLKLFKHPKYDAYLKEYNSLGKSHHLIEQEMSQRVAMLDYDFKEAKMNFISEVTPLKDFQRVYDELEAMVW